MNITEYKKKDGTIMYRTSTYLGIDQITGKKIKTTVSARTKKDLKNKIQQALFEFKSNGATRHKNVSIKTYSELLDSWWETYHHTVKLNTQIMTKGQIEKYLRPAFGSYKLEKLTPPIIQKQVNSWANEYNKLGKGFKRYGLLHSINKRVLQYGVTLQVIPNNPARDIVIPRRIEKEQKKIKYLNDIELKKFLDYLDSLDNSFKNYYDMVLYKTLLATGLRIRECVSLEWSDIDLEKGSLSVNKTLNLKDQINSPKSKSSYRTIELDKKTVLMLRLYKARQSANGREIGITYKKVFSNTFDEYRSVPNLGNRLKKHLENAGCPPLSFHAFRHTHASILLNAGLGYKEIQTRLGHSQLSMTMDIYSHLSKTNEKRAVSLFETALEKIKSS